MPSKSFTVRQISLSALLLALPSFITCGDAGAGFEKMPNLKPSVRERSRTKESRHIILPCSKSREDHATPLHWRVKSKTMEMLPCAILNIAAPCHTYSSINSESEISIPDFQIRTLNLSPQPISSVIAHTSSTNARSHPNSEAKRRQAELVLW